MAVALAPRIDSWEINPQLSSVLYSVLPTELRLQIFEHALTPDMYVETWHGHKFDHDFQIRYDHSAEPDEDWEAKIASIKTFLEDPRLADKHLHDEGHLDVRPGFVGRPTLSPTILFTCRRIFIEAREFLFKHQRCFWSITGPEPKKQFDGLPHANFWDEDRLRWESNFSSIRLFAHTTCLNGLYRSVYMGWLNSVEHFHITILASRWNQDGPDVNPLYINPFENGGGRRRMEAVMATTKDFLWDEALTERSQDTTEGESCTDPRSSIEGRTSTGRPCWLPPARFSLQSWGRQFVNMPRLKTLTIDFDIAEHKRDELAAIVDWAQRTWHFPLNPSHAGYHYLSASGNPVEKMSWQGFVCHSPFMCQECGLHVDYFARRLHYCGDAHKKTLMEYRRNIGPRMYSWSLIWTPRKHAGCEAYPYGESIPVHKNDVGMEHYSHAIDSDDEMDL